MASAMGCPCETRTSTCRSFATISSGLYRFLAIAVLLDVKDIPQVGPLQWGWITLEHPHDLFIFVSVRLNMDASPDAPPYEHSLITGENAAADLFADLLLR